MSEPLNTETRLDEFEAMPSRLVGEVGDRLERASRKLSYFVAFLDDYLRGILPNDLVLLGAPSGLGKTQLALNIASSNAANARKWVHYFALEAEPRELERRTKFSILVGMLHEAKHPQRDRMNYADWLLGECEPICGDFNRAADQMMIERLARSRTYYRGAKFTADDLQRKVLQVHGDSSLIVVDHLHYIDSDVDLADPEWCQLFDDLRRARLLEFARADLVAAMDPELVAKSEWKLDGASNHFLVVA